MDKRTSEASSFIVDSPLQIIPMDTSDMDSAVQSPTNPSLSDSDASTSADNCSSQSPSDTCHKFPADAIINGAIDKLSNDPLPDELLGLLDGEWFTKGNPTKDVTSKAANLDKKSEKKEKKEPVPAAQWLPASGTPSSTIIPSTTTARNAAPKVQTRGWCVIA